MASTHIVLAATAPEVRRTLSGLFVPPEWKKLSPAVQVSAQIVLAECLNNIVEHSYSDQGGEIDLRIKSIGGGLACVILDDGRPMPGDLMPAGVNPIAADSGNLPEGGFGWFLIRALAQDLGYRRKGNRNRLSFRIAAATNLT